MSIDIAQAILIYTCLILSLSVHEAAHAATADLLGDDTPRHQGRVTLNPLSHIDLMGTVILPLMMLMSSGMMLGWAKPVQINPRNFKNGRRDDALVTLAGPASNVLLAILFIFITRVFVMFQGDMATAPDLVVSFLYFMVYLNIILAIFNMIPVPPLDGHHLLPLRIKETLRGMGFMPIIIVFMLAWRVLPVVIDPIMAVAQAVMFGA